LEDTFRGTQFPTQLYVISVIKGSQTSSFMACTS
jgi:hypothetical protein